MDLSRREQREGLNKASQDRKRFANGANLFIGNLDHIMRRVTGSRGFGFISYDSLDASDAATEAMTGQYLYNCHAYNKDTKGEQQEVSSHLDETKEKIELQWNNFGLKGQEPRG
ncbi:hypothetical protein IGI04_032723 [Brassica rapa subsp. trilocularis]|uniref:RRM domain-containing protein n=1 Tax=Brassica rapa subsp. trilocularis TaxID=1813537 RepID=A0ABQ7LY19_BRACM|nr:hypothetical protein IGI04_032723 [Brassica rapa subsp. trilocularis]